MTRYSDPYLKCTNCGKQGVDLHHIKTRKSGGTDDPYNLMPLCRICHTKIHQYGLCRLAANCMVEKWLVDHGWEYNEFLGKWIHD